MCASDTAALQAAMAAHPELRPHALLEVHPPPQSWAAGAVDGSSVVAFHGTALHCLHSILHVGLLALSGTALERTGAAFGGGIYLSLDPATAFNFSEAGEGWPRSMLGPRLRCLLMCAVSPVREGAAGVLRERAKLTGPSSPCCTLLTHAAHCLAPSLPPLSAGRCGGSAAQPGARQRTTW